MQWMWQDVVRRRSFDLCVRIKGPTHGTHTKMPIVGIGTFPDRRNSGGECWKHGGGTGGRNYPQIFRLLACQSYDGIAVLSHE